MNLASSPTSECRANVSMSKLAETRSAIIIRKKVINLFWVLLLITHWAVSVKAQTDRTLSAEIMPLLENIRRDFDLPAIAAAVGRVHNTIALGATGVRILGRPTPVTLSDRFHMGSVTKPMTATMIATLVEEGKLSWSTTPVDVFSELRDRIHPSLRAITIEQLLTHRAGLPPLEEDEEIARLPKFAGGPTKVRRAFAKWLLRHGASSRVGEHVYSNAGYGLVAAMAERATGQSWESLMRERLFKPLGMTTAGFGWPAGVHANEPWGHRESEKSEAGLVPHSPKDKYQLPPSIAPAGDVHLSIVDFARFARLHLAGLNGAPTLLKVSTFEKLHKPIGEYALGWNIDEIKGLPASTHSGSADTFYAGILVYPQKDIAIVIVINASDNNKVTAARNKLFSLLLRKYGAIP